MEDWRDAPATERAKIALDFHSARLCIIIEEEEEVLAIKTFSLFVV